MFREFEDSRGRNAFDKATSIGDATVKARTERLFARLDLDGDGSITVAELCTVMEFAGMSTEAASETAASLMGEVDVDRSRTIERDEFIGFFQDMEV